MKKVTIIVLAIFSLSFVKSESPVAVSQSRALLTADVIFEGQVIKYDNTEVTIEIIKPIWNDLKNKAILKQSELVLPRSSKTHYSLRGQIPDVNQKAIFALKFDPKTKKLKHFFWHILFFEKLFCFQKVFQCFFWFLIGPSNYPFHVNNKIFPFWKF